MALDPAHNPLEGGVKGAVLAGSLAPPQSPRSPHIASAVTLSAASHAAFAIAITTFQPRRRTQIPIAAVAPMHWLRPSIWLCLFSRARTHCTTISLNFGRWAFAVLTLARRLCHHHHLFHRRYYSSAPASPSPPTSLPHRRRHHHYSCCPSATYLFLAIIRCTPTWAMRGGSGCAASA